MPDDSESISYFDDANDTMTGDDSPSATATHEVPATDSERATGKPPARSSGGMPKIVWVIGGSVLAAFMLWIFWPAGSTNQGRRYPPQTAAALASPETSTGQTGAPALEQSQRKTVSGEPTAPTPAAPSSAPQMASTASPLPATATSTQPLAKAVMPAPSASVMTASQGAALEDRLGSLEGKVDGLATRLDSLASQGKVASPAGATHRAKHGALASSPNAHTAGIEKSATAAPALHISGVRALNGKLYTINTIGRGIAWIQSGDHIEIVQAGDRIGQVRVLSIDPVQRRVTTSDGVIQ